MDCTATTGPLLLEREDRPASYGAPALMGRHDPPIYAAMVSEWRAGGRTVPGTYDAQWTALASGPPAVAGGSA
ncbi:hypothetical protein [Streptomyces sp. P17]|uniref:hypothetical protein n=1 Tax=Streptomyces sp. P17 TaxID=3074716 RepID=UPI0028F40718|nr:hypothetical protein [Streptomyces sp. P17]MDT9696416.1 hypothetical protein [Streptomyces sp. P17]